MIQFSSIFSQISLINLNQPDTKVQQVDSIETEIKDKPAEDSQEEDIMLGQAFLTEKSVEPEVKDLQDVRSNSESFCHDSVTAEYNFIDEKNPTELYRKFKYFPIKTREELKYYEHRLKTDNHFKNLLHGDLQELKASFGKNYEFADIIERVVQRDLLHKYNWSGSKGKEPLKCFRLFNDLIKEIINPEQGDFEEVITRAVALSHRRKNNQVYRKRLKHTEKVQQDTMEALDEAYEFV